MKLEKLQLFGFKSFPDKTEFKFKDGVTAIVGPNGAGKSNIVDAFRWILGEQSAKSLRGSDMKDVIFNGTAKRKPLGFAEASLTFSHAEDVLGEGNGKLAITRRLYRSGESEYLINGKLARLKDIKEILAGTGVGFNAYSILEQDKIDKILSANPEERRLVFEEAAGISGYRARRKKTERELERTEHYLARLGDIIAEVRTRERSVKIQAGRARRYRELKEKLGRLRLDLYALKFRGHNERIREIDTEIESVQREASELEAGLRLLESELARKESSLHSLGEHLKGLQSENADVHSRAVAAEEKITYGRQRIEELSSRRESLAADIRVAEEKIEKAMAERAGLESRLEKLSSQEAGVEKELKEHRLRIYEASVACQELEKTQEKLREKGACALEERSALRNELATLAGDLKRHRVSHGRQTARRDKVSKSRDELTTSIAKLEKRLVSLDSKRSEFERKLQESEKKLREAQTEKVRLAQQRDSLNIDRARTKSRLETLEALIVSHAGVSAGAQYLLSRRGKRGFAKVYGLLGELIEVDIENAPMVEAALDRLAEAVVVDTPQTAVKLAHHLKEEACGAALFVPVQWDAVPYPDCTGRRLLDLVRCDETCSSVLERLIGDVRISRDLQSALEEFAGNPGLRFVTPAGELVGAGALCGGSSDSGGIVQRKSEVAALKKELAAIENKLSKVTGAIEKQEKVHGKLGAECTKLSSEIEKLAAEISGLNAQRGELLRDCTIAETELRAVEVEITDLESMMERAAARTEKLSGRLKTVESEYESCRRELETSQAKLAQARELRESLSEQLTAVEVRLARAYQERESLTHELQSKDNEIDERRQLRASLETQSHEATDVRETVQSEMKETDKLLEKLLERARRIEEKVTESEEKHQELESMIARTREERNRSATALREVEVRRNEMRIQREACSTQIAGVIEYAREELGIEIDEEEIRNMILPDADPAALEEDVRTARQKIERLGNVNMEALDELEEIIARLSFYTNQEQDLITSKNKLLEVMAKIDRKCRRLLERSFRDIRENFQSVFRKLFGGGRADIYFEEGKDILEAGIEIVARPPGKDLSSLTLLSGGEKAMTTIALLFAIFRSKLSPFCILDEIDAPLDESNVNRFQQLLREFTGECRFLIITHNKVSMAAADTLYGITMQEPGVTKRISITFEEAAKHAREPQEEQQAPEPALAGAPA
jgi:chromosome segregation protein